MMKLDSRAEDWLGLLLWSVDVVMFPTWGKLLRGYESETYRTRWRQQWARLAQRQLIAREQRAGKLVCRLTATGRLRALGGRDPEAGWQRAWDGVWRQVLFDLPSHRKSLRVDLWRWLRDNHFGYLQHSVWVHPDPVPELLEALREFRQDVESFTIMEARCASGYSDHAIVTGAWDFDEINKRYEAYLQHATLSRRALDRLRAAPDQLTPWLRSERVAWEHAVWLDPLLPRALWPPRYRGEAAWQARRRVLTQLAQRISAHP